MISGEEDDSGLLVNMSCRNPLQDLYSNSSLLKSFGKEEELNLLNFYANANVASTPALGSNDNILYSHASSGAKGNSGGLSSVG